MPFNEMIWLPTPLHKNVLLVGDSNTGQIEPERLHKAQIFMKSRRYDLKEASENVQHCESPEEVTDIVFHVGQNDIRKGLQPNEIQPKILQMQGAYHKRYPKARLHICAMPPLSPTYINANAKLQETARDTGCTFISVKEMCNHVSQTIFPKYMETDKMHYLSAGISIIAKNIKHSLHSGANLINPSF
jgi:hypothetical protein